MKTKALLTGVHKIGFLFFLSVVLLFGCSKDKGSTEPTPEVVYKSYVSHEYIKKYSLSSIQTLFSSLQLLYPDAGQLANMANYDVEIYKIEYKTMLKEENVIASGLVCIPIAPGSSFPIISFQNGTNTAHANAPSVDLMNPMFQYLHASASMGYVMIIPDYLGFGSSEQITHPYMHKESTVDVVENMILATIEMMDHDLIPVQWDEDLYLIGYSQGGWSTLTTHFDISQQPALSYSVTASACGAGPYDLSVVQNYMFEGVTYPQPVYMAYTGISYHALGLINNPLTDLFNEPYASALPGYFSGEYTNAEINTFLTDTVARLIAPSFLIGINDDPLYGAYRTAINNNSIHGWNTKEPIRLYHGSVDTYVPPATTEKVYGEFVAAGASDKVVYIPLPGQTHTSGIVPMAIDALLWFSEMENKSADVALAN